jgi:hypothetical protein
MNGKDITQKFNDVGHSAEAKKILSKLKRNKTTDDKVSQYTTTSGHVIDAKYLSKKLFTKEDEYNIHKFFGFFALVSFVYRYLYVLPTTGTLGFTGTTLDIATLLVHFFLSFSSLIFHVVAHRIIQRPLIIYEEYRMHAILFTTRCLLVSLLGLLCQDMDVLHRRYLLGAALLVVHLGVDYTTKLYGTPGVTAVRNHKTLTFKYLGLFYSYYQIAAVASHIVWCDGGMGDLGYNTLIAIQSSAFLMTLKRKNIIKWYIHAFWYSVALALSYYYMWVARGTYFFMFAAAAFFFRSYFNLNKYLIWTVYAFLAYYMIDNNIDLSFLKQLLLSAVQ